MSKLARKTLLQFGSTANPASEIGQYGSYAAPIYSNDIDVLQAGTAWPRGWVAETIATNRPFLEDFNAIDYVFGYMLCYLLQEGIPEYDAATTYYIGSYVNVSGQLYISLMDNNTGNTPGTYPSFWAKCIDLVTGGVKTGVVQEYAGSVAPTGYLLCDGSAVSRSTYADLFAICGTAFGVGDGSTTFNLPDKRQRVGVGYKSGDSDFGTLGQTGGEKTHTLSLSEIPAHIHNIPLYDAGGGSSGAQRVNRAGAAAANDDSGSAGGGGAHNNIQPYQVFNYIIKT